MSFVGRAMRQSRAIQATVSRSRGENRRETSDSQRDEEVLPALKIVAAAARTFAGKRGALPETPGE
jgi:hypothetical protein